MKRVLAALTHQSVIIEGIFSENDKVQHNQLATVPGIQHPVGKNFPKLRAGTMASCLTFMMNLYDAIVGADNLQAAQLSNSQKMREIVTKIQSSNLSNKTTEAEINGGDNSGQKVSDK